MKNVSGQEYQTPRQAADELDISPQTLRAYSGLVEKTTGRADYFHRDQNNGRLYSAQNIADLSRVNKIKKEIASLEKAVKKNPANIELRNYLASLKNVIERECPQAL